MAYIPGHPQDWSGGRDDGGRERVQHHVVAVDYRTAAVAKDGIYILGFACDEGVRRNKGRGGAKEGPAALRRAAGGQCYHRQQRIFDAGTVVCTDTDLESAQAELAAAVAAIHSQGGRTCVLGGGHETAWGHFQGLPATAEVAILNFDAHLDLRPTLEGRGHSGSPFFQIAEACAAQGREFRYGVLGVQRGGNSHQLMAYARQNQVGMVLADDFHAGNGIHLAQDLIRTQLESPAVTNIYVSLCLDAFAAAVAPGVSAPQAMGLMWHQVAPLLRELWASPKVRAFDIVELAPPLDDSGRTVAFAAGILMRYLESSW